MKTKTFPNLHDPLPNLYDLSIEQLIDFVDDKLIDAIRAKKEDLEKDGQLTESRKRAFERAEDFANYLQLALERAAETEDNED